MSSVEVARQACALVGLPATGLSILHEHATAVYLQQEAGVVIRVSSSPGAAETARRAVAIAGWLTGQGFPATAPADGCPPVEIVGRTVAFWRYYPQHGRPAPPAPRLGEILRSLHALPPPPVRLPEYQPLEELGRVAGQEDVISDSAKTWLLQRRAELVTSYGRLNSVLGSGFVHGDAYPGNTLWDGNQALLGDWDEVATAPREMDLVNTYQGARFGRPDSELDAFTCAYGYDVRRWDGFPVLLEMRSLHTLSSYIRRAAAGSQAARAELDHRIRTLMDGDTDARWHSAS